MKLFQQGFVHDEAIFVAIYNKNLATLRLYLLNTKKELVLVQKVNGNQLEDCVFFQENRVLYMALAVHFNQTQNIRSAGMYLA